MTMPSPSLTPITWCESSEDMRGYQSQGICHLADQYSPDTDSYTTFESIIPDNPMSPFCLLFRQPLLKIGPQLPSNLMRLNTVSGLVQGKSLSLVDHSAKIEACRVSL